MSYLLAVLLVAFGAPAYPNWRWLFALILTVETLHLLAAWRRHDRKRGIETKGAWW